MMLASHTMTVVEVSHKLQLQVNLENMIDKVKTEKEYYAICGCVNQNIT